ncbi:PLP-dependent aminotransferase family protein [Roseomonas genomospecies 6]|uniref:PLP-dependent aminotransferase family protein n=1 Tax=Roseomonas genomospecies 6 TaxID=214106 RepID=A0A9W7NH93_9PROT|nr:PLP-dependent aminotransferase family protein [Roseomonas genomospecies 6]KAA0678600.1 PLP-dependent aminotransferase family protein [Roseomonas genomospecies 6]
MAADLSDLMLLPIDRTGAEPLLRQVYRELRRAILSGALPPGGKLPPTRALAERLGVARNTVVAAYEQLLAEGFIEGRVGAGSFVSRDLPDGLDLPPSEPVRRTLSPPPPVNPFGTAPFSTGRCALDERSLRIWRSLTLRRLQRPDPEMMGYGEPGGPAALRQAIARYLQTARAVRCEPEQVIVTAGAQQAIDLVLRVLLRPGDPVWLEDPCYPAVRAALEAAQVRIVPVPVDGQGLDVAAGVAASPDARLAYVTPSSHYPLGVVLPMARRMDLLAWARRSGAWVLEDDYDSEFRYAGRPLASLQGIDGGGRVIYVGTFSKVLFPGLRLGYAVLPPELVEPVLTMRRLTDWHPATLYTGVVTDFLEEGHFGPHLRRMRRRYMAARDALAEAIGAHLSPWMEAEVPDQGMKLIARLRPGLSDRAVEAVAARHGIAVRPVSPMHIAAPPLQGLMLGFTGHEPGALRHATRALGGALSAARLDV